MNRSIPYTEALRGAPRQQPYTRRAARRPDRTDLRDNLVMSTQATYDDANLILRLYELRREEKLRRAREWFSANFHASTLEEAGRVAPLGSEENAYMRMVISYWDMAASLVTSGVLNQDLFLKTNGECLYVWERVRALAPAMRDFYKNPNAWSNLETVGNAFIKQMEANGPDAYPAFQAMVHGAAAAGARKS